MLYRKFGRHNEQVSVIGVGGYHFLEISDRDAINIMNAFIDRG